MLKNKFLIILFLAVAFFSFSSHAQTPKKIRTIIVDAGHGGQDGGAHGAYEGGLNSWEKNITLAISNRLVLELQKELPDVKIVPTRTTDIYQSPPEKADIANANKGDLFICIHADAVGLKTGSRQIGTRVEIRHTVYYVGKGRKKKKMIKSKSVVVPVYEYFKIGCTQQGTSVWIFAAHKTDAKLKAIMNNSDFEIDDGSDSTYNKIDFSSNDNRMLAQIYAKRYQDRSIRLASLVNDEISNTDRPALGINQRQKGIWVLQATNMPAILVETGFITNHDDERYLNSEKGQQEIADCITRAVKRYKEQMENPKPTSEPTDSSTPQKSLQ
jgi:N-acetylmuramoyl-L-alanine amidase